MFVIRNRPTTRWPHPLLVQPRSVFQYLPYRETSSNEPKEDQQKTGTEESKTEEETIPTQLIRSVHVAELDDGLLVSLDVPGVKDEDIVITECDHELKVEAVRKSGDKTVAKFQREFSLDKKSVDPANMKAYLADGVLSLKIPKKPAATTTSVTPSSCEPPEESEGTFHFRLELPGVKTKDLKIDVTGDQLSLEAERQIGKSASTIKRTFVIDEDKLDVSKMEAYLSDGILTLTAPVKQGPTSAPQRTFQVHRGAPMEVEMIKEEKKEEEHEKPVAKGKHTKGKKK